MNRPAWLDKYKKPVRDQITIVRPIRRAPAIPMGPGAGTMSGTIRPGYTGAGADGRVQPDMPVAVDKLEDHEGEYIISAADVKERGGPKGIERKLKLVPQQTIRRGDTALYATGGLVVSTQDLKNAAKAPDPTRTIYETGANNAMPPTPIPAPAATPAAMPALQIGTQTVQTAPGAQIPGAAKPAATPALQIASQPVQTMPAPARAPVTPRYAGPYGQNDRTVTTPGQNVGISTPGVTPRYAGPYGQNDRTVTTPAPVERVDDPNQIPIHTIQNDTSVVPGGEPTQTPPTDESRIADAQNVTADLMDPNSDTYKAIATNAFNGLAPQLQTNLTLAAMNIAQNPNMSEGAKRAMLMDTIRNNGIAESDLAAQMADKALGMISQAAQATYNMASGNRTFAENVRQSDRTFNENVRQYDLGRQDTLDAIERGETSTEFTAQWGHYEDALAEGERTGNYSRAQSLWTALQANPEFAKWMPKTAPDFTALAAAGAGDRSKTLTSNIEDIITQNEGDPAMAFSLAKDDVEAYLKTQDPNWDTYDQATKDKKIKTYFDNAWGNTYMTDTQRALRTLMNDPNYAQYFDTDEEKTIASAVIGDLFDNGGFFRNERTGRIETDPGKIQQAWKNPKYEHVFLKNPDGTYSRTGWTDAKQSLRQKYVTDNAGKTLLSLDDWDTAYEKAHASLTDNKDGTYTTSDGKTITEADLPGYYSGAVDVASVEKAAEVTNPYLGADGKVLKGGELSTKFFNENGITSDLQDPDMFLKWLDSKAPDGKTYREKAGKDMVNLGSLAEDYKTYYEKNSVTGSEGTPIIIGDSDPAKNGSYFGRDYASYWDATKQDWVNFQDGDVFKITKSSAQTDTGTTAIPGGTYKYKKIDTKYTGLDGKEYPWSVWVYENVDDPSKKYLAFTGQGESGYKLYHAGIKQSSGPQHGGNGIAGMIADFKAGKITKDTLLTAVQTALKSSTTTKNQKADIIALMESAGIQIKKERT